MRMRRRSGGAGGSKGVWMGKEVKGKFTDVGKPMLRSLIHGLEEFIPFGFLHTRARTLIDNASSPRRSSPTRVVTIDMADEVSKLNCDWNPSEIFRLIHG